MCVYLAEKFHFCRVVKTFILCNDGILRLMAEMVIILSVGRITNVVTLKCERVLRVTWLCS